MSISCSPRARGWGSPAARYGESSCSSTRGDWRPGSVRSMRPFRTRLWPRSTSCIDHALSRGNLGGVAAPGGVDVAVPFEAVADDDAYVVGVPVVDVGQNLQTFDGGLLGRPTEFGVEAILKDASGNWLA